MTRLTVTEHVGRPARPPEWFTSAAHVVRTVDAQGMPTWTPAGEAHGRQVGSRSTACGLVATDWPMLFDRRFRVLLPNLEFKGSMQHLSFMGCCYVRSSWSSVAGSS